LAVTKLLHRNRGTDETTEVVERPSSRRRVLGTAVHTSFAAVVAVMMGVAGLMLVLTGVLSRPGVVVGIVGVLFAIIGLSRQRAGVGGGGVAALGLLLSLGAVALGVAVVSGSISWLSTDTDMVGRVHDWLSAHVHWLTG
jgi:hypothetical protein